MPAERIKVKKPPSCDRCKAKRVLCHPAPPGQSCPRCIENAAECTTTPVVRRKPVRKGQQDPPVDTNNESASPDANQQPPATFGLLPTFRADASTSQGGSPDSFALITGSRPLALDELPSELIIDLFETFRRLPQRNNPIVQYSVVRTALERVNWRTALLPLEHQALVFSILASAALISIHPAILGDGPIPASLRELDSWPASTDWGAFGRRREPAFRALRDEALRLAKEAEVTTNTNTICSSVCYLVDALLFDAGGDTGRARPYAVAYITHARTLAETLPEGALGETVRWSSFFATEAVRSSHANGPILFSKTDQRLLHGDDIESLEQLEKSLIDDKRKHTPDPNQVFGSMRSYGYHVIEVARTLDENACGSFAKRRPLTESAITTCLNAITRLSAIHSLLTQRIAVMRPTPSYRLFPDSIVVEDRPKNASDETYQSIIQSIRIFVSMGNAAGILSLHLELQRRWREEAGTTVTDPTERRARERMALVRNQVKEMAREAARDMAASLGDFPSLPHATHFRFLKPETFAVVLLEEVQETAMLSLENAKALESLLFILRIMGFAHGNDPHSAPVISAIEHQLRPAPPLNLAAAPHPFAALAGPIFSDSSLVPPAPQAQVLAPLGLAPAPALGDIDLGQLELDLAATQGADESMNFMNGIGGLGMDDWFSSAMMGMATPGLGAAMGGAEGGFSWPTAGEGGQ